MGIVRRQSIKIIFTYGIGILVGYFNLLWLFPYCLNTEEIGLVQVLRSAGMLLGVFIPFGAQKILIRFFPFFKDQKEGHSGLVPFTLLIPLLGTLLWGGLLFIFRDIFISLYEERSPLFVRHFYYVLPVAAALAYHKVLIAYGRSLMKAVIPNFLQSVGSRLLMSLAVILYFLEWTDQEGMVQGYMGAYVLTALLIALYCYRVDKGSGFKRISSFPYRRIPEMIRFGFYMTFTSAGGILLRTTDDLMLGAMLGLSDTGIYSISFLIGAVIEQPKRAVLQTLSPTVAKARKDGDLRKIDRLYKKGSINNLLLGGLLFLGVWMNLDDLFRMMPKGELFKDGKLVVLIIGLSKLTGITIGMANEILMTSKWYRFNFYSMLITIPVLVGLNFLFIPIMGIEGAALATLLASTALNISRTSFLWFKESIHPFTSKTLLAILLMGVVFLVTLFTPMPSEAVSAIIVRSVFITILFGIGAYSMRISEDAHQLIAPWVERLKGK